LFSDTPVNIAIRSIEDILNQSDSFLEEIDAIITELVQGNRDASFRRFTTFLSEFKDIIQLLQTIETLFNLNYAEVRFNDKSIRDFSEELVNILTEIKNAMENEDLVTLTDLLEYEVKENVFGDLKQAFGVLSQQLKNE